MGGCCGAAGGGNESESEDSVGSGEVENAAASFAKAIKLLVDEGKIGSSGLGRLTGVLGEGVDAADTALNWGKFAGGVFGLTFQYLHQDIDWYINPEGMGRLGPTGLYYPGSGPSQTPRATPSVALQS